MKNYYKILGIEPDAGDEDIKQAYRRLARRYHPDLGGSESAPRFEEINEAYRFLSDSIKRMSLDAELSVRPAAFSRAKRSSSNETQGAEDSAAEAELCRRISEITGRLVASENTVAEQGSVIAELEAQISAYESLLETFTRLSYAPPRRELSPVSISGLIRANREKRALRARRKLKITSDK